MKQIETRQGTDGRTYVLIAGRIEFMTRNAAEAADYANEAATAISEQAAEAGPLEFDDRYIGSPEEARDRYVDSWVF
jgi:hypothetical protein